MRCLVLLAVLSGCTLYFHSADDNGDDCVLTDVAQPAPLRNPDQLTCESFGSTCDPSCGPCPAVAGDHLAPIPSWGTCGSDCEPLDEITCGKRADCRVVEDLRCAVSGNCPAFLGCFPTDQFIDPTVECRTAADGFTCSRNPDCTAFHRNDDACPANSADCPRAFVLCMAEGAQPGRCFDFVACDRVAPNCPPGTVPGVVNNCYSDACIPSDLCEPPPPPMP